MTRRSFRFAVALLLAALAASVWPQSQPRIALVGRVERADVFKLAVNLGTAQALGVQVPESVLLRANHVIR